MLLLFERVAAVFSLCGLDGSLRFGRGHDSSWLVEYGIGFKWSNSKSLVQVAVATAVLLIVETRDGGTR